MAENVGAIHYTVEADTQKLLDSVTPVDKSLNNLNKTFSKTDKAANQANFRMKKTAAAVKNLGKESSNTTAIMRGLTTVLSAAALIQLARGIVNAADAWTDLQNRLRLVTKTNKELEQSTNDVFRIAQTTSQEIDSIAQVYQRFAQNADTLGVSLDEVAEVTEIVAKAVAVSGASAQGAEAALTQFGQALASGVLRGEELNSVMEQTPALANAIAQGMGITIGQLRAVAAEGKITADQMIAALKASSSNVNEQFNTRIKTTAQSWTELRNSIARFLGEANNASALATSLSDSLDSISNSIDNIDIDSFTQEIEGIKAIVSLVMDGVDELMRGAAEGADESAQGIETSFTQMALELARIVDGIAIVFQGTAGSVSSVWRALANNIPAFFSNAWNEIKQGAAGFVNDLADLINKPLQAIGFEGFSKVAVDAAPIKEIVSLTQAAADGWNQAAKGVGAYERTLKRVTDNAIQSAINSWQDEYLEKTDKVTESTKNLTEKTKEQIKAEAEAAKARKANNKVIEDMAAALMLAGLSGKELAIARAESKLNVFATPEEMQTVRALAAALYEAEEQAKAFQDLMANLYPEREAQDTFIENVSLLHGAFEDGMITLDQYIDAIARLETQSNETFSGMSQFADMAFTSVGNAFADLITKGEADFQSFANNIISEMVRMMVQAMIVKPIMKSLGFAGGGLVGGDSWSASAAAAGNGFFASGGYTGDGGKYDPAGIVHKGEYVITKEATSRIGVGALNRLNYGYANGGLVGSRASNSDGPSVAVNITNNSSQPVTTSQPKVSMDQMGRMVVDVMIEDLRRNGPYARQLRGS